MSDESPLRRATIDDLQAIDALMKTSIASLFPAFYDARQTRSSVEYIGVPDITMLEDGTYFVIEAGDEIVACGGWSQRDKLYTGSGEGASDARLLDPTTEPARVRAMFVRSDWTRRGLGSRILEASEAAAKAEGFRKLSLMATLPGFALYEKFGFRALERIQVAMPDGVTIECVAMEKGVG